MSIQTGRRQALGWVAGFLALPFARRTAAAPAADCAVSTVEKALYCPACKMMVGAGDVDGGKHKACGAAVQEVDACVKTYYECPSCKSVGAKPGPCPACGKERIQKVSKARVIYRCPKCGKISDKPGTCPNPPCGGPELKKTCEQSGKAPHAG